METSRRPIGWWLKHLDGLLEQRFTDVLAAEQLTRRHWQALNVVNRGPGTEADVVDALRPFWAPGAIEAHDVVADLLARGWVARAGDGSDGSDGSLTLTDAGRPAYEQLLERVNESRRAVLDGFTPEEYRAVVDALARMSANLERVAS